MNKHKIEVHEGGSNVFADLGLPNAEERLLKANIVAELHRLIKRVRGDLTMDGGNLGGCYPG